MADVKILGKVFNGVSKLKVQNASGGGTTEFSAGGGEDFGKLIDKSIVNAIIPADLTKVGKYSFYYCDKLKTVSMGNAITKIESNAFAYCSILESVVFGNALTEIEGNAFMGCYDLVFTDLPDSLTKFGNSSFNFCKKLKNIKCKGVITAYGTSTFLGNSTYSMEIETARFPNATSPMATSFGSTTAANACHQLNLIDLGKCTAIQANAFANCYALNKIILRKTGSIATLTSSSLTNTPFAGYNSGTGVVYVPSDLIDTYKAASNWSTLYNNGTLSFAALETSPYADPDFVLS